ncbi:MAG: DUF368 domain-containing protein [Haloarculaceae archaeon]
MTSTAREYLIVYLKGIAMGTADAVPGMSGGTIALITGIYERLIGAITSLDPRVLRHVPRLGSGAGRRALLDDLVGMDVPFLLALVAGIGTALVVVARAAHLALAEARVATFAFFLGLIGASVLILYREVQPRTAGHAAVGAAGLAIAVALSQASGVGLLPHTAPAVVVSGTIGITAMVLPGISGASILLLLGQYEYLSGQLSAFVDALLGTLTGGPVARAVGPGTTVAAFGLGALVGVFTVAHLIKRALASYRTATLTFLVSLLTGTLWLPVVKIGETRPTVDPGFLAAVLVPAVVGGLAVLALDRYTDDLDY